MANTYLFLDVYEDCDQAVLVGGSAFLNPDRSVHEHALATSLSGCTLKTSQMKTFDVSSRGLHSGHKAHWVICSEMCPKRDIPVEKIHPQPAPHPAFTHDVMYDVIQTKQRQPQNASRSPRVQAQQTLSGTCDQGMSGSHNQNRFWVSFCAAKNTLSVKTKKLPLLEDPLQTVQDNR